MGVHENDKNLARAIACARGQLDADFRRGDMLQASLDAADISRLAYAAFYVGSSAPAENPEEKEAHT